MIPEIALLNVMKFAPPVKVIALARVTPSPPRPPLVAVPPPLPPVCCAIAGEKARTAAVMTITPSAGRRNRPLGARAVSVGCRTRPAIRLRRTAAPRPTAPPWAKPEAVSSANAQDAMGAMRQLVRSNPAMVDERPKIGRAGMRAHGRRESVRETRYSGLERAFHVAASRVMGAASPNVLRRPHW